jgi:replication factor C large subunit
MHPFIKKYSPKLSNEVIGQDNAISQILSYVKNYKKEKKKAALLHGPTGVGKTTAAHAVANELGLEIFELNASDFRNKDQINQKLGAALKQQSLFSKGKLILIDELDGLSGTKDRGGIPEILKLVSESVFPVLMTALNPYDKKLSKISKKAVMIEFEPLSSKAILDSLKKIVLEEKLKIADDVLSSLSRRAGGDLRAAINDLEIISTLKDVVTKSDLDDLGMREKEDTIINALLKIFKSTDPKIAISAGFSYSFGRFSSSHNIL